jgi:signal transduction histidine kinase
MLGVEPETLIQKSLFDLVIPEDSGLADEHLRNAKTAADMYIFELRVQATDGRVLDTRWSCLWSASEEKVFCIVQDVTEQKKVERLKEDFFGMISHDLRSPLSSLYGSLKLIVAGAKGPVSEEVATEVKTAANNVERLVRFVNDLLDFQKLKAGRMELDLTEFDLLSIISEAIDMVRSFAQAKGVQVSAPAGQWDIVGDRGKLVQTLVNLLGNAIKFTAPDTTIVVDVIDEAETIEVCVTDCGPGVPEEFRDTIFNAFEQVPSAPKIKQGTGLGLAICKLIIKAHKGLIGCRPAAKAVFNQESAANPGTTFWFRIPKLRSDSALSAVQMQIFDRAAEQRIDQEMNAGTKIS